MALPYHIIDAFTSSAFAGNPAAVVLLAPQSAGQPRDDAWHLNIAREFNLAETAFLIQLEDHTEEKPSYLIRWFTVTREFPLCGHATLASAWYLFHSHHPNATHIYFQTTMSGPLSATRTAAGLVELDFPADHALLDTAPEGVNAAQVIEAAESSNEALVGRVVGWGKGKLGTVVEVDREVKLAELTLDAKKFIALHSLGYVVFTQAGSSSEGPHIKSRVIIPYRDNREDPVTGSAHTLLTPYYLGRDDARARLPVNASGEVFAGDVLQAKQVSARGGDLEVEWDTEEARVKLRGEAVVVMEGTLRKV